MIGPTSRQMIEQLNRAYLYNPIPFTWFEPSGFCIQNDFTHLFAFS